MNDELILTLFRFAVIGLPISILIIGIIAHYRGNLDGESIFK